MKQRYEAERLIVTSSHTICAHTVDIVCEVCGFDIAETDLNVTECPSCEVSLGLKQSITVEVTPIPMFGVVSE
jgi:rubrerythrin